MQHRSRTGKYRDERHTTRAASAGNGVLGGSFLAGAVESGLLAARACRGRLTWRRLKNGDKGVETYTWLEMRRRNLDCQTCRSRMLGFWWKTWLVQVWYLVIDV